MPNYHRRHSGHRRRRRPPNGRPGRNSQWDSNQQHQQDLPVQNTGEDQESFRGMNGMTDFLNEDASQAQTSSAAPQALAAVEAAYATYDRGVALHGEDASWETTGSNRGPIVDELEAANGTSGEEWCGMFIGDSYKKAGIREEIMANLVFWSGYRLHLFFTQGQYIGGSFGSWWQPHRTVQIGSTTGEARKAELDAFSPQPGDIALFRSDYSHVGMVTSYDANTGTLNIIEGNRGNRVQTTAYETGDNEITFLGRFNDSDYSAESATQTTTSNRRSINRQHRAPRGNVR